MNFKNILVPTDLSEHSTLAIKAADALAKQTGGSLTLLYIQPPMVVMPAEMGPLVIPPDPKRREALVEELTNLAAKLGLSVPVTIRVEEGHPWSLICETAGVLNAEVIVISSHGYTGLKRMLLGSTAEQVVRHATCPVLVVKSFQ